MRSRIVFLWGVLGVSFTMADELDALAEKLKQDILNAKKNVPIVETTLKEKVKPQTKPVQVSKKVAGLFGESYFDRQFSSYGFSTKRNYLDSMPLFYPGFVLSGAVSPIVPERAERRASSVALSYVSSQDLDFNLTASPFGGSSYAAAEVSRGNGYFSLNQDLAGEKLFLQHELSWAGNHSVGAEIFANRVRGVDPGFRSEKSLLVLPNRFESQSPFGLSQTENYAVKTKYQNKSAWGEIQANAYGGYLKHASFMNPTGYLFSALGDERQFNETRFLWGGLLSYKLDEVGRESRSTTTLFASADFQEANSGIYWTSARQLQNTLREDVFLWHRYSLGLLQKMQWVNWIQTEASVRLQNDNNQWLLAPGIELGFDFDDSFALAAKATVEGRPRDSRALAADDSVSTKVVHYEVSATTKHMRRKLISEMALFGSQWEAEPVYDPFLNRTIRFSSRSQLGGQWTLSYLPHDSVKVEFQGTLAASNPVKSIGVPHQMLSVKGTFKPWKKWELGSAIHYIGSRDLDEAGSITGKAFTLADVRAAYSDKSFSVDVGLENIFNSQWNEAEWVSDTKTGPQSEVSKDVLFRPGKPLTLSTRATFFF